MRNTYRLFVIFAFACVLTTTTYFSLAIVLGRLLIRSGVPSIVQAVGLLVIVFVPFMTSSRWIAKKLLSNYSHRVARSTAIAYVVFTPLSLIVAVVLSPIIGAYAEGFGKQPFFGLLGAFLGIITLTSILSFSACMLAIWIVHRGEENPPPQ